jgi:tetratricopeptide (TPR) repeat protein
MFRRCRNHPKIVLAVAAAALLTAVAGGAFTWAYRQANKKRALLAAAAAAESAGDWSAVENALRRYANLRGDDAETCQRIGNAIERGASDEQDRLRALPFYAKAVSLAPDNDLVRLQFAELLIDENPVEAVTSAEMILQRQPDHPDAWRAKALGLGRMLPGNGIASRDRLIDTHQALDEAIGRQPGHLRLASQVAEFNHRNAAGLAAALGKPPAEFTTAALATLDRLVAHCDDEAEARLTRLLFRRRLETTSPDDPFIKEDLQRLVELRPSSTVVRLLAAGWATKQAFPAPPRRGGATASDTVALSEAVKQLEAAVRNRSDDPLPHWSLAQLHWWCGERQAALHALEQGRQSATAENLVLNMRLAELQLAKGRWADAESTLRTLDQIENTELRPIIDLLWAQWWLAAENPEADPAVALPLLDRYAEDSLRRGLRGLAVYLRGLAFASLGRWDEAAAAFHRAAQITDSTALPRLGVAHSYYRLGRYRDATLQYRSVLTWLQERDARLLNDTQIWIEAAHCAIAEQSQRPAWKREWRGVHEAVAQVRSRLPDSPIPLFLELEAARWDTEPKVRAAAEARLSEAEQRFGQDDGFWALWGAYRLRVGDWSGAQQAVERWERSSGQAGHIFRAELAQARGDVDAADRYLQAASVGLAEHRQRQILTRRVQIALQCGRVESARKLLEERLSAHPDDPLTLFELAQVAWSAGDAATLEQTSVSLQQIQGDKGRQWRIARTQALLLAVSAGADAETKDELVRTCSELVARFPEDRQVWGLQALVAETVGRPRKAVQAWRQAVALGEQSSGALLRLASLLHDQGQSREALEISLALSGATTDCRAASLAARILTTAVVSPREQELAEDVFRTMLTGPPRPDLPLLLLNLGVLREYQGRPEEAVALTRQGLEWQPEAVELKNNLAWFLTAYLDDHTHAGDLIDQAIRAVGPLPALLDTQGVVLLAAGRTADAIRVLESSVQGDSTPAASWLHLAEAYHQAGKTQDAMQRLEIVEKRGITDLTPRDRRVYLRLKAQLFSRRETASSGAALAGRHDGQKPATHAASVSGEEVR